MMRWNVTANVPFNVSLQCVTVIFQKHNVFDLFFNNGHSLENTLQNTLCGHAKGHTNKLTSDTPQFDSHAPPVTAPKMTGHVPKVTGHRADSNGHTPEN